MAFILPARRFCLNARGGAPSRDIYLDIPNSCPANNTRGFTTRHLIPPRIAGEERKIVLAARFFRVRVLPITSLRGAEATRQSRFLTLQVDCFAIARNDDNEARNDDDHEKIKGSETPADALCFARTQAACGTRHGVRRLAPPSACGRARLPAFHYGSHQRDFRPEGSASGQASRKRRESCGVPHAPFPVTAMHLARRSYCRQA
jgi:hypothetical protein